MYTTTPRLVMIAAALGGLVACDSAAKNVREEKQDIQEQRQEASEQMQELRKEQRENMDELANDTVTPTRRGITGEGEPGTEPSRDFVVRHEGERVMPETQGPQGSVNRLRALKREQEREREQLARENAQELREEKKELREAKKEANERRAEIMRDKSERLRELTQRANELRRKAQGSEEGRTYTEVAPALANLPAQREAIEADIEALRTVEAVNLSRAKDRVEQKISKLEEALERAEDQL